MAEEQVQLATDELRVEVLPQLGGRIRSLVDAASGREWLWRNDQLGTYGVQPGADYDSNWQGGWEELFPNDAATALHGRSLPDHGELWSVPWEVVERDPTALTLRTRGFATGVDVTKRIALDGATCAITYTLDNPGPASLPYLFKLHPAVAVHGDCRLELPGGTVEAVDPSFSRILPDGDRHDWPGPTGHDVAQCHDPESELREFVYVHDVPEGRVGVRDDRIGRRLEVEYPLDVFRWCWFFLTYGGWNDLQVAVLEPCTTYPKDLHTAIEAGTTPELAPGVQRTFTVRCSISDC